MAMGGSITDTTHAKVRYCLLYTSDIVMSLIPQPLEKRLLQVLGEQMALSSPGKGIAFTISLDSISSAVCHHADPSHHMQTTTLKEADFAMSENKQFALIAAVIPHGESDLVAVSYTHLHNNISF